MTMIYRMGVDGQRVLVVEGVVEGHMGYFAAQLLVVPSNDGDFAGRLAAEDIGRMTAVPVVEDIVQELAVQSVEDTERMTVVSSAEAAEEDIVSALAVQVVEDTVEFLVVQLVAEHNE